LPTPTRASEHEVRTSKRARVAATIGREVNDAATIRRKVNGAATIAEKRQQREEVT
jgi:hypothetical protein